MSIHNTLFSRSGDLLMGIEDNFTITQCYKQSKWSMGTHRMSFMHEEGFINKKRKGRFINVTLTKKGREVQDHLLGIAEILYKNRR